MEDIELPEHSTLLIDANFLIGCFTNKPAYDKFISAAQRHNVSLSSIELVRAEFLHNKPKDIVEAKQELFSELIPKCVPFDDHIGPFLKPIIQEYENDIEGVSTVDIFLACYLKRYPTLYLLTGNHKDFPTKMFDRTNIFSVETAKEVKTYALYRYKTPKRPGGTSVPF